MKTFEFLPESETRIFINGNSGITVTQWGANGYHQLVAFGSKSRAVEVANAILELAEQASFKVDEETEDDE